MTSYKIGLQSPYWKNLCVGVGYVWEPAPIKLTQQVDVGLLSRTMALDHNTMLNNHAIRFAPSIQPAVIDGMFCSDSSKVGDNTSSPFQPITSSSDSLGDSSSVTAKVLSKYDELIGERGREAFEQRTIPMAMRILGHHPERVEEILLKLIDKASYAKPEALDAFWNDHVTADTFEFQKRYDELLKADDRYIEGWVFHITKRDLLGRIDTLVPANMRSKSNDEQFAILLEDLFGLDESLPDHACVCFAHGTIDQLARYLTGHALTIEYACNYTEIDASNVLSALEGDGIDYLCRWAVAAVRRERTTFSSQHNIETYYDTSSDERGYIDVYESKREISIEHVITIPLTVLTDDQTAQLRRVGEEFYTSSIATKEAQPFIDIESAEEGGSVYVAFEQRALAMKYALVKFAEQHLD